jgi:SAM-dependent methyltransferase
VDGYGPTTYGDGFADVYDDWYADVSPPAQTAAFVAERVDGLVVELGSGTGRLAGPLLAAGAPVVGLDASLAMLRRSRDRHPPVPVVVADMAEQPFRPTCAGGVLLAFNTLFNLPDRVLQRHALRQAALLVAPHGVVIVEAFVPADDTDEDADVDDRVDVVRLESDLVVLRVSRTDRSAGTVSGHHVELRDGEPVRLRPWHLRFTGPAGLDALAATAGLALVERCADWTGAPFDERSHTHVSVYRATGTHH